MLIPLLAVLATAVPTPADEMPDTYQLKIKHTQPGSASDGDGGVVGRQSTGSLLGVDSIPNFNSFFYLPGLVSTGFGAYAQWTWPYTMVGRSPMGEDGSERTTRINAPIIPVIVDLRNADGSPRYYIFPDGTQGPRMILDATQYVDKVLKSPIFQRTWYDSSERPTQYTDAVHRAQFFHDSDDDWHTILVPHVMAARTVVLLAGTYHYGVNRRTGKLRYVLVDDGAFNSVLFPPTYDDTSTLIGGAEHAGDMRTRDITTFLFPDTFLYSGGDPSNCCILGFHTYDVEPGDAVNHYREKRYVLNYSSWITPGLFGSTFSDITALSHELSETFSDPFVGNATPIWQSPNGLCQANLEDGDVIEGLPNATFPITMNGFTYHPQNEALLQWFAGQANSSAIHHAYSYPDTTVLTSPAVAQAPGCSGPAGVPGGKP